MYFKKTSYETDMEILATEKNLVTFSGTVLASNATTADENGRKYVKAGSFIDATGAVITPSGTSFTGDPVGILYQTVDVTNGDVAGSIIVEGYLREDRIFDGYEEDAKTAAKAKVPHIKFI